MRSHLGLPPPSQDKHKRLCQPPCLEEGYVVDAPPTADENPLLPQVVVIDVDQGVLGPQSNSNFHGQGQELGDDSTHGHPIQAPSEHFNALCELALDTEDPMNEDDQIDTPRRSNRNRTKTTWYDDEVEEEKQKLIRNGGQKASSSNTN